MKNPTSKKSTRGGARPNTGGAMPGAGRKRHGQLPGKMLPWSIPGELYPATIERVQAHAAATGRSPGQVIADAVGMLPTPVPPSGS